MFALLWKMQGETGEFAGLGQDLDLGPKDQTLQPVHIMWTGI